MRQQIRGGEARAAAASLSDAEGRVLELLSQMPLLWAYAVRALAGLGSLATAYRCIEALASSGLVDRVRPHLGGSSSPSLYHLTDLGIGAVAVRTGKEPTQLARDGGLRGKDLLRAMDGLPHRLALYDLAACLVPDGCRVVRWQRPWRRHYYKSTAKSVQRVVLPAYLETSDEENHFHRCLLIPDSDGVRPDVWMPQLARLAYYRVFHRGDVPAVVIATSGEESIHEWRTALTGMYDRLALLPLPVHLLTWDQLAEGLGRNINPPRNTEQHADPIRNITAVAAQPDPRRWPVLVGDIEGALGLTLSDDHRRVLVLIGRHPFLASEQVSLALGIEPQKTLALLDHLLGLGLVRRPGRDEIGRLAELGLHELTVRGLEVVAAGVGLSRRVAVKALGLSGGGPDGEFGHMRALARQIEHTLGVNRVFVGLFEVAADLRARGSEAQVAFWEPAAACAWNGVRPDGRAALDVGPVRYEFVLEYDRGTERERHLRHKFAAYQAAYDRLTIDRVPDLLVITQTPQSERDIARLIEEARGGISRITPALITTEKSIQCECDGLLARIWREATSERRRHWLRRPRRVAQLGYGHPLSEPPY